MDEEVKIEEKIVEGEEIIAEQPVEDIVYLLDEMVDEMKKSIDNVKTVLDSQKDLIDFVTTAPEDKFNSLVVELNASNSNLEGQIDTLSSRSEKLEEVVAMCKDNEQVKDAVNKLAFALGVFRQ